MRYIVVIMRKSTDVHETWAIDPATRREFPLPEYRNQTFYGFEERLDAERVISYLARLNPGAQVFMAEVQKAAQIPVFLGDVSMIEINDKGMLPI